MLTRIIYAFEDAWQRGERPDIQAYLPAERQDPSLLRELILVDLDYREKARIPIRVEEYLSRFPHLRTDSPLVMTILRAECRQRRQSGEHVTLEELGRQFPDLQGDLPPSLFETLKDEIPRQSVGESTFHPPSDDYEDLEEVGRGGMGVVYRARQRSLGRTVALKVVLAGTHAGEEERERFRQEARTVAELRHPHIVQIYEIGERDGHLWLSLEYCEGGTLAEKLRDWPMPSKDSAELVRTLAQAIQAAHEQRIIHRDLKPANVLFQQSGLHPKITDFGLAKRLDGTHLTQSGAIVGTPSYMAPEQAQVQGTKIGPTTDVYALGAILYECLTTHPPFRAANAIDTILQVIEQEPVPPSRLQPKVPRDLETICLKCLQKDPGKRYPTAQALADDLDRFLQGRPITARPVGYLERGRRWCRRNPVIASLSALLLLVLLGTSVGFYALWQRAEGHRQTAEATSKELGTLLNKVTESASKALVQQAALQLGTTKDQLEAARTAASRYMQIPNTSPADEGFLVVVHALHGDLVEQTNRKEAMKSYQEGLKLAHQLVQKKSTPLKVHKDLVQLLIRMQRVHRLEREFSQAEEYCLEGIRRTQALLVEHPGDKEIQRQLITLWNDRGYAYEEQNNTAKAKQAYDKGQEQTEQLAKKYPNEIEIQNDLAVSLERNARIAEALGQGVEALKSQTRVLEIRRELIRREPKDRRWKSYLSYSYRIFGDMLKQRNNLLGAKTAFDKGYGLATELTPVQQASAGELNELAIWHERLGAIYWEMNNIASARTSYEAFLALQQKIVAMEPDNSLYLRNLTVGYNYLGRLFERINDVSQAAAYYQKSLPIATKLAKRYPKDEQYQRDLGFLFAIMGQLATNTREFPQARSHYLNAIKQWQPLADQNPTHLVKQLDLANLYQLMARIALFDERNPEEAIEWSTKGLNRLTPFLNNEKLKTYPNLEKVKLILDDLLRQSQLQTKILADLSFALKLPPDQVYVMLSLRGLIMLQRGNKPEAIRSAEALVSLKPPQANAFYDAACVHAKLIGTPDKIPLAVCEHHTSLALRYLRESIRLGFRDLDNFQRDPDLNALRSLKEYRDLEQLLKALSEKK